MTQILINGEEKETISAFDRGIQYGDGLFETMAVLNGKIPLWDLHWERLNKGCEQLSIISPGKEILEKEIATLCADKDENQFIIKIIITRGVGERGYRFSGVQNTTRIISCFPLVDYPMSYQTDGVTVRYCETTLSENKKLAGIKHLNRLEQVLARNEWDTDDYQEGLMLTTQGHIIDGTMSNLFAVKDKKVFTPDLSLCGVSGVMRKTIINLAKELELPVYEKTFTKSELEDADELFLTNSLFGIWPVKKIAKTQYTKVGAVTQLLQEELKKIR